MRLCNFTFGLFTKGIDFEWCRAPDVGLPEPDLTLFLAVSAEVASLRGGFGEERYESREMQDQVRELFAKIGNEIGVFKWRVIDAGPSMEEVEKELLLVGNKICTTRHLGAIGSLWSKS